MAKSVKLQACNKTKVSRQHLIHIYINNCILLLNGSRITQKSQFALTHLKMCIQNKNDGYDIDQKEINELQLAYRLYLRFLIWGRLRSGQSITILHLLPPLSLFLFAPLPISVKMYIFFEITWVLRLTLLYGTYFNSPNKRILIEKIQLSRSSGLEKWILNLIV